MEGRVADAARRARRRSFIGSVVPSDNVGFFLEVGRVPLLVVLIVGRDEEAVGVDASGRGRG